MAKHYIDETGLKHVWGKIEEKLSNFETTEEIMWVNCEFNFGNGQAEKFTPNYADIVQAFNDEKAVKLVASYGADDEPQHAIGDLIHYREDENVLEFAVFVYANILTQEHALHHFRVVMNPDNSTETEISVLGGSSSSDEAVSPTVEVTQIDNGHRVTITDVNGSDSFDVMNGAKGDKGDKGDTPQKGTDYWTASDKQGIVTDVLNALPTWTGGSY